MTLLYRCCGLHEKQALILRKQQVARGNEGDAATPPRQVALLLHVNWAWRRGTRAVRQ